VKSWAFLLWKLRFCTLSRITVRTKLRVKHILFTILRNPLDCHAASHASNRMIKPNRSNNALIIFLIRCSFFLIFDSFLTLGVASFDPHYFLIFPHFCSLFSHFSSFLLIFAHFSLIRCSFSSFLTLGDPHSRLAGKSSKFPHFSSFFPPAESHFFLIQRKFSFLSGSTSKFFAKFDEVILRGFPHF
jgi:hypothetical protein